MRAWLISLRARDGRQDGPEAVAQGYRIGTGHADGPAHEPHLEPGGLGQDVGHLEGNGVRRILVEDLSEEIAAGPDDGRLLQLVVLVEIRGRQDGIHIPTQTGLRRHPDRHRNRPRGGNRPCPTRGLHVVSQRPEIVIGPLIRPIPHEDEVVAPIELGIAVIHHLDGHRHQIMGGFGIVDGQGVTTDTG